MNLRDLIIKEYQATVRNSPSIERELKEALAVNERVPAFIDNLCVELANPVFKNHSNNQLKDIVVDATSFFISLVKQKAHERMMSEAAKMAIKQDISDTEVINKACDTGVIDEEVFDVLKRQDDKIKEANEANSGT